MQDSIDDIRKYELIIKDPATSHYQIDEKNGIVIDAFYLNESLYTIYEVMGNNINLRYKMNQGAIEFDISMHKNKELSSIGDTIIGRDTIPEVSIFKIRNSQSATLKNVKQKEPH